MERFARRNGIWERVDPATPECDLPKLLYNSLRTEPPWVRETKNLANLNDDEYNEEMAKASAYGRDLLALQRKQDALNRLWDCLHSSVHLECENDVIDKYALSRPLCFDLWEESTIWKQIRALSEAFDRPTPEQVRELEEEWLQIQYLIYNPTLRYYLNCLDDLLKRCTKFHMVKRSSDSDPPLLQTLRESPGTLRDQPWFVMPELLGSEAKDSNDVASEQGSESNWNNSPPWSPEMSDEAASKDGEEAESVNGHEKESEGTEEADKEENGSITGWEYCGPRPKPTNSGW